MNTLLIHYIPVIMFSKTNHSRREYSLPLGKKIIYKRYDRIYQSPAIKVLKQNVNFFFYLVRYPTYYIQAQCTRLHR